MKPGYEESAPAHRAPLLRLLAVFASAALAALVLGSQLAPAPATDRGLSESGVDGDAGLTFSQHVGRSVAALLLTVLVGPMASAAGVGGGALYVPLFTFCIGFSVKGATALSQATITGGSLAAVAICMAKPHPIDPAKPLVDCTLSLMLLPSLLLGVSLGVLANRLFPNWLVTCQLIVLLSYLSFLTARKALQLHRAEQRAAEASREQDAELELCRGSSLPQPSQPAVAAATPTPDTEAPADVPLASAAAACQPEPSPAEACEQDSGDSPTFVDNNRTEQRAGFSGRVPWAQLAQMLGLWGAFLALQLLKARHGWCSPAFFALYAAQVAFCLATAGLFLWQAHRAQQGQAADAMARPILEASAMPRWTLLGLLRVSIVTLVAGTVAGLLGIGGGMVVGPLLLELGVHPAISAATSSLMVLFSASTAVLSFGFDGALNRQFALIFGLSCAAASLLGMGAVARAVKASGKARPACF